MRIDIGFGDDADPIALTPGFTAADSTQKQWTAFVKRTQLDNAPKTLDDARERLRSLLVPIATALIASPSFPATWTAPGPRRLEALRREKAALRLVGLPPPLLLET